MDRIPSPPSEFEVFLEALHGVPPRGLTACDGWTAHEVVAHLASGADLLAEQARAHLDGTPAPVVDDWAVRDLPYQAMDDRLLRRRLETGEREMTELLAHFAAADPAAVIPGLGWGMPVGEIVLHMRQEFAVHRWDLTGDDARADEVLARPELLGHSVRMLQDSLLAKDGDDFSARIRSPRQPDLLVEMRDGKGHLALVDPDDSPALEADPAARLLLLWGRRPSDPRRVRSDLSPAELQRLQHLLRGF
ncbi:maleylpyruvate isomerase N-terminal domain-containing protein [Actinoplanes sp. CA-142083]|uniref:maleylpyruvate isomerase N-terminal domain-containing protein n=1 Tax=Actinoplanes sp. CA-142083 TaxID=3239903 RepID=UPI003D90FD26